VRSKKSEDISKMGSLASTFKNLGKKKASAKEGVLSDGQLVEGERGRGKLGKTFYLRLLSTGGNWNSESAIFGKSRKFHPALE